MGHFSAVTVAFVSFCSFLVVCSAQHSSTPCPSYDGLEDDVDYDMLCRRRNGSEVCEGRGKCECGKCACGSISPTYTDRRYTGSFCECNNYNCDYFEGELCGGPWRGKCICGNCQCAVHYAGSACGCLTTSTSCMASNGLICNGKGICICGTCDCSLDFNYKGPTCEDCPLCRPPESCESLDEKQCQSITPDDRCYHACSRKKNDAHSTGFASRSLPASVTASILVVLCASLIDKM